MDQTKTRAITVMCHFKSVRAAFFKTLSRCLHVADDAAVVVDSQALVSATVRVECAAVAAQALRHSALPSVPRRN